MQRQINNSHFDELKIGEECLEYSTRVLEALPSLPVTQATSATGVGICTSGDTHARSHGHDIAITGTSNNSPVIASYNIPPAQIPAKRRNIYFVSAFCSLGGLLFGADTGSIGSITSMPQFVEVYPILRNEAVLGALVATILMSASLSSFASGWLSDKYSRKRTIMLGAYIFGIGAALEAGSVNLEMLIIGRLIVGGQCFYSSSQRLFHAQPPNVSGRRLFLVCYWCIFSRDFPAGCVVRGRISCMLQLFVTIGIALGYFICYGTLNIRSTLSWRIPFIFQALVSAILGTGMPLLPYSPRWLFQNGRVEEAWRVLESFDRHSSSEKEKEELVAKSQERQGRNETVGVIQAFRDPDSRGRTLYGPILFSQAGLTSRQASFLASGVSGIINVICTIPAQLYLLDNWGRRSSAIVGGLIMAVCMLAIGSMYAAGADAGQGKYAILVFIYFCRFSTTWAVSFKVFITEIQPMRVRATASSLAHSSNWLCNLAVALTTPLFLSRSSSGPYFMFGACLLLTSVVCMIWMPETLGKSLEEVDEVWEARMKKSKEIIHSLATFGVGRERRNNADELEMQERARYRYLSTMDHVIVLVTARIVTQAAGPTDELSRP
ncbi:MFS sugar transporter [Rhizoctonia solani AG-1 IA]|uniref:MFS sugar transporter n=1 Tax=Thanatephorus cucumeris (strain AG1-IA) TaxID=983506 RepID=L8WIZ3_THACA|nr:MFS sugar transporter [Rhizoctonia solani AG-1 IA]